jgi:hypothetical protein
MPKAKPIKPTHKKSVQLRNRVVERKRMLGRDLQPNPANWRQHPPEQAKALHGVLTELGQVGEVYAYLSERAAGQLVLIDGHLRCHDYPDQEWDVAICDLSDAEADKILLTRDPLGAMAEASKEKIEALLRDVHTEHEGLAEMLEQMAIENGILTQEQTDGEGKKAEDSGPEEGQFCVVVICEDEEHQKELLERFTEEKLQCRALIS